MPGQPSHDGQPEAVATARAVLVAVPAVGLPQALFRPGFQLGVGDLIELLEDALLVFWCDARSTVPDL
jgi:hypothetical protein